LGRGINAYPTFNYNATDKAHDKEQIPRKTTAEGDGFRLSDTPKNTRLRQAA